MANLLVKSSVAILGAVALSAGVAFAHCDIPCGIDNWIVEFEAENKELVIQDITSNGGTVISDRSAKGELVVEFDGESFVDRLSLNEHVIRIDHFHEHSH